MKTTHGACLCGEVRYEFDLPTKYVANCHCSECRRASAAPFVTWVGTWDAKLRLLAGQEHLGKFAYNESTTREFCRLCGSQLFFRAARWPGEVHVTRATVSGQLDREIQAEMFYSDRAEWWQREKMLPTYGGKSGVEPI
jgi:hypothetical protein